MRVTQQSVLALVLGVATAAPASAEILQATYYGVVTSGAFQGSNFQATYYYDPYISGSTYNNSASFSSLTDKYNESAGLTIINKDSLTFGSSNAFSASIDQQPPYTNVSFDISDTTNTLYLSANVNLNSIPISLGAPFKTTTAIQGGGNFTGFDLSQQSISGNLDAQGVSIAVQSGTAPVLLMGKSAKYNLAVNTGNLYYLQTSLTNGATFETGAGDPNFQSVVLPDANLSYDLIYTYNGQTISASVADETQYLFPTGGVSAFELEGLTNAASNAITGLSFVGDGTFTGSLVSAVPLPATAPLFGAGLLALGVVGCGLKRSSRAAG